MKSAAVEFGWTLCRAGGMKNRPVVLFASSEITHLPSAALEEKIFQSRRKTQVGPLETSSYLSANVGFRVFEDEGQVFNTVGLKEDVDFCLAGERGAHKRLRLESQTQEKQRRA